MAAVLYQRQRALLEYVQKFIKEHGYSPTLEEMAKALGLSSLATVHEHLKSLEAKGIIRRNRNEVRGIEIASSYNTNYISDITVGGVNRFHFGVGRH